VEAEEPPDQDPSPRDREELTDAEAAGRINAPFLYRGASTCLEDLARGKGRVIIPFDDLSRWTPAYTLAPPLVATLQRAGIERSRIHFMAALGSHRAMSREEMALKLGRDIVGLVCGFEP
jgi:nickel-dependent lactate racemase